MVLNILKQDIVIVQKQFKFENIVKIFKNIETPPGDWSHYSASSLITILTSFRFGEQKKMGRRYQ